MSFMDSQLSTWVDNWLVSLPNSCRMILVKPSLRDALALEIQPGFPDPLKPIGMELAGRLARLG